jgi:amidophosphoribosyltransferase
MEMYNEEKLEEMINRKIRQEKIAIKDVKLKNLYYRRCQQRRNGTTRVRYYLWYCKKNEDTLVVIDDSIVRGTTLKQSIVTMLSQIKT